MVLTGMNRFVDVCCFVSRGRELSQVCPIGTRSVALLNEWRQLRQAALEKLYL